MFSAIKSGLVFLLFCLGFVVTPLKASENITNISSSQKCPFGYKKEGNSCLQVSRADGGKWYGDELRCNDGYVRLEESNTSQRCHQLQKVINGKYAGPRIQCARGFVPVNFTCMPRSMIHDRNLIMSTDKFCPRGYQESGDSCIPNQAEKSILVQELSVQGVHLGMSEENAFAVLLSQHYEHFEDPALISETRGFLKKESDGSMREVYLNTNGRPLAVYEIVYTQAFPDALFSYQNIRKSILQYFGRPNKINDFRQREVFVYQDEPSTRSPTLTINFPGNQINMHVISRNLEAQLIDQKRLTENLQQKGESNKPLPVIKF